MLDSEADKTRIGNWKVNGRSEWLLVGFQLTPEGVSDYSGVDWWSECDWRPVDRGYYVRTCSPALPIVPCHACILIYPIWCIPNKSSSLNMSPNKLRTKTLWIKWRLCFLLTCSCFFSGLCCYVKRKHHWWLPCCCVEYWNCILCVPWMVLSPSERDSRGDGKISIAWGN